MTHSTPATRRRAARPGGRATSTEAHATQTTTYPKMNHSINFEGDWALHGIMSDLGVNYALSPFHRIGFEIDEAALPRHRSCSIGQALNDGEDYELLLAISPNDGARLEKKWRRKFPRLPLTRIGRFTRSASGGSPVTHHSFHGYVHFQ